MSPATIIFVARVFTHDNAQRRIKPAVRLDFMTDDVNEAKEMRIQTLASGCVAEIRNSNGLGWVAARGGCWQMRRLEGPSQDNAAESDDAAQQLIAISRSLVRTRLPFFGAPASRDRNDEFASLS